MANAPPRIFSGPRRHARRARALALQARPGAARFLLDDVVEDLCERLAFLRHTPARALVLGDPSGTLAAALAAAGAQVESGDIALDLEQPLPFGGFDLIAGIGLLDTVNDLPGALIHLRNAMAPGGLLLASFGGAGSLQRLRAAMLAAEPERTAARMHPLVDARAGAALLQRTGWADPVTDSRELTASYRNITRLVADLREMGLGNTLASPAPPLTRAALARAQAAFLQGEERAVETFAILTLSGRRPSA